MKAAAAKVLDIRRSVTGVLLPAPDPDPERGDADQIADEDEEVESV